MMPIDEHAAEEAETDRLVDDWQAHDDVIPLPVALETIRRVASDIEAIDRGGGGLAAAADAGGPGVVRADGATAA